MKAIIALMLMLFVASVSAQGGKFKDATLESSCDDAPCFAGNPVTFSGSGYGEGQVMMKIGGLWTAVQADESGSFSFDWTWFQLPGVYEVQSWKSNRTHSRTILVREIAVLIQ